MNFPALRWLPRLAWSSRLAVPVATVHLVVLLLGAAHAWGHAAEHGGDCTVCRVVAGSVATLEAPATIVANERGRSAWVPSPAAQPRPVAHALPPARGPPGRIHCG